MDNAENVFINRKEFLEFITKKNNEKNELIKKLYEKNPFWEKTIAKKKVKSGKKPSPLKLLVQAEIKKIIKEHGDLSANEIARMSKITKILAKDAGHVGIKDLSKLDYKKRYGVSLRTVEGWIREAKKK